MHRFWVNFFRRRHRHSYSLSILSLLSGINYETSYRYSCNCQKLHKEVPALKDLGVEVRYLAYPRAGVGSPAFRKMASAWCADDAQDALTRLKLGKDIPDNVCDGNPVTDQYKLGGRLGVTGTPALITAEGELIPGYLPADKLAKRLGL